MPQVAITGRYERPNGKILLIEGTWTKSLDWAGQVILEALWVALDRAWELDPEGVRPVYLEIMVLPGEGFSTPSELGRKGKRKGKPRSESSSPTAARTSGNSPPRSNTRTVPPGTPPV